MTGLCTFGGHSGGKRSACRRLLLGGLAGRVTCADRASESAPSGVLTPHIGFVV